jgi:hypothetical protein
MFPPAERPSLVAGRTASCKKGRVIGWGSAWIVAVLDGGVLLRTLLVGRWLEPHSTARLP